MPYTPEERKAYNERNRERRREYERQHRKKLQELRGGKYVRVKQIPNSKSALYKKAKSRPCAECGGSFPPFVMDFDHCRGEKLFNVSDYSKAHITFEMLTEEIAKCELICSNCHHIRTYRRRGNSKLKFTETVARKKVMIIEAKNKPCTDCNKKFNRYAMQFDHVRGEKKFNLSTGHNYQDNLIIEEIDKCDVVCSNCHRIRTQSRGKRWGRPGI